MPSGIQEPAIGYTVFCVVKFAGYSLAAHWLSKLYKRNDVSSLLVGGCRTLLGMAVGAIVFDPLSALGLFGYLFGLFPIRVLEWWLTLRFFYFRKSDRKPFDWPALIVGTGWSYVLDLPATIGFVVTGGFYVC